MKKLLLLLFVPIVFFSCNEIMPTIPDLATSDRVVLIEEFTGVGCQNCPAGSKELDNLLGLYPNNLIAVSVHAGFFSDERNWNDNQRFDFRTESGSMLTDDYFGGAPFAFPSATVNRERSATNNFFINVSLWPGAILAEFEEEVSAFLTIDHDYEAPTRNLSLDVFVDVVKDLPEDVRISVLITEDRIIDYQLDLDANGWVSDYEHNHVLRDIVTNFDGEDLDSGVVSEGSNITKSFSYTMPEEFVAENCHVIAFIHRNTTETKEVLQAIEVSVVD